MKYLLLLILLPLIAVAKPQDTLRVYAKKPVIHLAFYNDSSNYKAMYKIDSAKYEGAVSYVSYNAKDSVTYIRIERIKNVPVEVILIKQ